MEFYPPTGCSDSTCETDYGPSPLIANIMHAASQNQNFRTTLWTGNHLQMTLMHIPPRGEIGIEMHPDTDQFIRVEEGRALLRMGSYRENLNFQRHLNPGDAIFVPSGTWHNIFNTGSGPLKISSFYAPAQHPRGTIHRTKADAENTEY